MSKRNQNTRSNARNEKVVYEQPKENAAENKPKPEFSGTGKKSSNVQNTAKAAVIGGISAGLLSVAADVMISGKRKTAGFIALNAGIAIMNGALVADYTNTWLGEEDDTLFKTAMISIGSAAATVGVTKVTEWGLGVIGDKQMEHDPSILIPMES